MGSEMCIRDRPKAVSLTDPLATWVAPRARARPLFTYDANYLIDNKLGVIVDAEGTLSNRIEENRVAVAMVARVKERFDLKPKLWPLIPLMDRLRPSRR